MANPNQPQNLAIIEPFAPPKPISSRRLPPPCWSPDETVALIEAYRDKWYSLRRGNLRATHWQEVADGVADRCPGVNPKTSIQCRHKMEKLRKRYRAEIQRIGNNPNGRRFPPSAWAQFKLMDDMELGFGGGSGSGGSGNGNREDEEEEEEGDEEDVVLYPKGVKHATAFPLSRRFQGNYGDIGSNGNGVRIRLPNVGNPNRVYDDYPPSMNPNYGLGKGMRDGYVKEREQGRNVGGSVMKRKKIEDAEMNVKSDDSGGDVMNEMVWAIHKLADGFVKTERMKMDMAREFESMRMKMEMKRTEMILESQQKLWESFMETFKEKKDATYVFTQAAWNDDVEHLLKEIDTNPYMLHAMALEGGETPLHIACLAGHFNFAVTVIKLREEFSWELNQDGFSPLHIAAASGHVEIVKELLKVDLGLCLIKGKDRKIPLHMAVVKGKVNVIRKLILSSLETVECTTAQGENSLHLAVNNNQFEAFQVLIQHLKHVNKEHLLNSKDFDENTILHLAVARKQYEVVDFLLNGQFTSKEKIDLNTVNKSGMTPLDLLLIFQSESSDRKIEKILIEAGALKAENLQSPVYIEEERPNHCDTIHENPLTPTRKLVDYFKYNNLNDSPSKVRNTLLVIVILITSATYQPALNPPGGTWQEDSAITNMSSSTKNNSTINKPRIAGEAIMGTNNPIAYSIFVVANSMGFYMSLHMISVLTTAFPLRMELLISIIALAGRVDLTPAVVSLV